RQRHAAPPRARPRQTGRASPAHEGGACRGCGASRRRRRARATALTRPRGGIRSGGREHGAEALDEKREGAQVRCAFGKAVLASRAARREASSGREATLPPQDLHGGSQNAVRLAEAAEVLGEKGAVRGRTELEDE